MWLGDLSYTTCIIEINVLPSAPDGMMEGVISGVVCPRSERPAMPLADPTTFCH